MRDVEHRKEMRRVLKEKIKIPYSIFYVDE